MNNETPRKTSTSSVNNGASSDADKTAAANDTPLQPPEPEDESLLQSIGNAISAPVRDAAEDEERKQVGQPRKG